MLFAQFDWQLFFFVLYALVACVFALAVLFSNNIVRMAFYLVISLGAVAGLFFIAGAQFIGAMQLLIYVGGTLVLLIFGVMLTAQEAFVTMKTRAGEWVAAAAVGGGFLVLLLLTASSIGDWRQPRAEAPATIDAQDAAQIGSATVGVRVDKLSQSDPQLAQGMSGYLLPFEIVSVHLLVVLVGAAYLARARRRASARVQQPGL
jgi:NADH:ubiquinone oxidoreductase subunit 6 (subunit J)